jgi:hypothetical protein
MAQGHEERRSHPRGHEPYGDDSLARRPYGPQPGPSGQQQEAVLEGVSLRTALGLAS